jgi:outer membrane biosynthesis protein TonB
LARAKTPKMDAGNVTPPGQSGGKKADGLTPEEILKVIRAHMVDVRHCYEHLLQEHEDASGKLALHFTIGLDGSVTAADKISAAPSLEPAFVACVLESVRGWRFPRPRNHEPVQVNYPFEFQPS